MDDQDMQTFQRPSGGLRTVPSKPRCGRDGDGADENTVSSLKRTDGDTALEFGGIPIAGEGIDDESTSDSDDSNNDLVLNRGDMTPEQLIRVLRQGRQNVYVILQIYIESE